MRYRVIVVDENSEVLATSEEPVELKYLVAEGRDVANEAYSIGLAREKESV